MAVSRSNLVLLFPDIPHKAIDVETSHGWNPLRRHFNLYHGERSLYAQISSSSSTAKVFTFTMQDATAVDYIAIARADILIASSAESILYVQYSNNKSSWTTAFTKTIGAGDLVGVRKQDYVFDIDYTGAHRYWRVTLSGGSGQMAFSKLYFGKAFDPNCNPDSFKPLLARNDMRPFVAESGVVHQRKTIENARAYEIIFEGVSNAKANEFVANIANIQATKKGIFLWNPKQKQILDNNDLLHCDLIGWEKSERVGFPDWFTLSIQVQEMIG